jgi:integrase
MAITDKEIKSFLNGGDPDAPKGKRRMLSAGKGLFLVAVGGSATWQLKFQHEGKSRTLGLGPYPDVSLEDALDAQAKARLQRRGKDRIDPVEAKRAAKVAKQAEAARVKMTFKEAVLAYLKDHGARWTDPRAIPDWKASLRWAERIFGEMDVAAIDPDGKPNLVLKVLRQDAGGGEMFWSAHPLQAQRVRARMQAIFGWAMQTGLRPYGPNPAEWSLMDKALPPPESVRTVEHHDFVAVGDMPAFMGSLRAYQGAAEARRGKATLELEPTKRSAVRGLEKASNDTLASKALDFMILTATRTGDVLGMTWSEVDLDRARWTISIKRYKTRRKRKDDVRIPLSADAVAILTGLQSNRDPKSPVWTFSNREQAMLNVMRDVHATATAHGTARGSFRSWCSETSVPFEVAEAALGHVGGNAVVQAYQHSDYYDRRVPVMAAWALHCRGEAASEARAA